MEHLLELRTLCAAAEVDDNASDNALGAAVVLMHPACIAM
jgi:hypothetical protein